MKINLLFNSIFIKIIGLISMTFDHISKIVNYYNLPLFDEKMLTFFDIIGRISFPIFAFFIIEGLIYTRSKYKYVLRLSILAISIDLIFYLATGNYWGNPITTLALGALFIYLFEHKKTYIKFLSILPITYITLLSFEVIPLYSMYDLYGFILIILFYLSYKSSIYISDISAEFINVDKEEFYKENHFKIRKLLSVLFLLVFTILIWFINPIYNNKNIFIDDPVMQLYSILSIFPILIYNGKKGYNNKWIQIIFYLYFPLHLCILYLLLVVL